ncbi:MAG: YhgE/Pip C-terminal domain protein [Paenibacillaceae bacterium]|nr:YhgE/Pip C-terminal domain protein [Paenibacillaceae bacterium]
MKRSVKQISHELAAIAANKKVLISVAAVALIPLLYSFMFLWAFWDPYAKMDVLPVAVVNMDQGASFEGKTLSVGSQFVDKLKETPTFEWNFVSQSEAEDGLRNHKYYIAIEIPEDFSTRATKILEPNPEPAVFRYIPNESSNFLASQIGKTAVERMKSELSAQLTKSYTETLFESVGKLSEGLTQAADGASRLSEGTKSVEAGAVLIDENLGKLSQAVAPLQAGVGQLAAGADRLNGGLAQLQTGADRLNDGLAQLTGGHGQLVAGGSQAELGAVKLKEGLGASSAGLEQLDQAAGGLALGLQQLTAAVPELAGNSDYARLVEASKLVAGGLKASAAGEKQLAAGADQLVQGQRTLNDGLSLFDAKLAEAAQGSQSLDQGMQQLIPGGRQLQTGLGQVADGMLQFAAGTQQLNEGARKLADGALTVAGGTDELSGKLKDASVQTSAIKGNDQLFTAFAQPVAFEEQKLAEVPNYGTGFAPYFLSLGLFVGALLLTIVFPVKEPALAPASGISWFFGKLGTMLLIGFIQAVVMAGIVTAGLGLELQNIPMFFLFSILTSWTFMVLIQMLVTLFADPGRFIAIVILILQLTTCAGTFPVELIPDALRGVNTWLPMTYTVQGYKAVISSGEMGDFWRNAGYLGVFILVSAGVTLAYFIFSFRRHRPQAAESGGQVIPV